MYNYTYHCYSTALAVLKKHYHALWRSFPDDHMITLSTLCETFDVHSEAIEMITNKPTSEEANQVILNYIIFITKGDQQMNAFCDLMIKLINNPKLSKITKALKSGMYVCTYAVLEITVGHWSFSGKFQHLVDQNPFWWANFTVHFKWDGNQ